MSTNAALLLLFVVLPLVVAPLVIAFIARRSPEVPAEHRTSWLLEYGEPMSAELISWKNKGPFLLDSRPMVEFKLRLHSGDDLSVTQSTPRSVLARIEEGMTLEVRMSPDRVVGAVVFPTD